MRWILRKLKDVWYFIRCHTFTRYHIINIAGADGEYRWGWIDRDHAMLLACFRLLVDFVENEDPGVGLRTINDYCQHRDAESCEFQHAAVKHQLRRERQIRQLYRWWTQGRAQEHAAAKKAGWPGRTTLDMDERDQRMLQRLISVRGSCWT